MFPFSLLILTHMFKLKVLKINILTFFSEDLKYSHYSNANFHNFNFEGDRNTGMYVLLNTKNKTTFTFTTQCCGVVNSLINNLNVCLLSYRIVDLVSNSECLERECTRTYMV